MKSVLFSVAILIVCVLFIGVNSYRICRDVREFSDAIAVTDLTDAQAISDLYQRFQKRERFFALTVNHTDLTNLESAFAEWHGAALVGDSDNAMIIKSRLADTLEHLGRQVGFSTDGIL